MLCRLASEEHPAGGKGLWGTDREVPSFLYAMPLPDGRVFLEETCLVAKPALPFATLKRRLERRLASMNVEVGSPALLGLSALLLALRCCFNSGHSSCSWALQLAAPDCRLAILPCLCSALLP